jgi:pantothenate kinase
VDVDVLTARQAVESVAAQVEDLLAAEPGRVVVGVTGPPGAGKTTFAGMLARHVEAGVGIVPMDGFHLSSAQLDRLCRRSRKGAPDTFDVDGYIATLARIRSAFPVCDVYVPAFDRAIEEPIAAGLVVPGDVRLVVTEGNYLALWDGAREMIDKLYYVDAKPSVRRTRLVERHVIGGRSAQEAADYVDAVDESNARLIATTQSRCDRVLVIEEA